RVSTTGGVNTAAFNALNDAGSGISIGIASTAFAGYRNINAGDTYILSDSANTDLSISMKGDIRMSTGSTATERMRITSTGNVGIGTAGPEQLLTLSTSVNNVPIGFYSSNANASNRNWVIQSNSIAYGDFDIRQSNAIGGNPRSAGTSRLYIKNEGNVGIGTTSPTAKLMINHGATYNNEGLSTIYLMSASGDS
ncbi:hypothetical protein GW916_15985, partial [bacterium]|nr:hypothetical protein [bacterium]